MKITTLGFDLAKNVFQVHGVDTEGQADSRWLNQLLDRRCTRVASVALANKTARIAWAILARGEVYRATRAAAA